jgi:hypothetical protein
LQLIFTRPGRAAEENLSYTTGGRNWFRPYLFFKECVTMEKFWNNEELEVIETLEPFPLSEKVQILKDSILEESNLDNLKILKSVLDGFHS